VTSTLALRFYPEVFPVGSSYRHDVRLHWLMAIVSGLVFFASILAHELAHSLVAERQGVAVKGITLFIFGGVSQITSESRRPLHEFIMAIVGPLTSVLLGALFFLLWWLVGGLREDRPVALILEWLFLMNIVVGIFNLAPGFPMDGGRVVRAALWGLTGNFQKATRWATLCGRAMGYLLMAAGLLAGARFVDFVDPWSGLWFFVLGLFLEQSARQSWLQAEALRALGQFRAGELMNSDLQKLDRSERVRTLPERGAGSRRHFIYFVSDASDNVVGVVTEKELAARNPKKRPFATAEETMLDANQATVASPGQSGARLLEQMEAADVWHLPVVEEGRVVGVVSKEKLLRFLGRGFARRSRIVRPA
jgi:Zn-dependent protease/CBS domain-containing protein